MLSVINCQGKVYYEANKDGGDCMERSGHQYLIGDIQIDEIRTTKNFRVYAELEQKGLATKEDYKKYLDKKYKIKRT